MGRLDKNSLGLLLFTNDGDMTRQLTHPSYRKKKIYQVSLDKPLTRADMDRIAEGITLEDGEIHADEIAYVKEDKSEIGIEIHSGRQPHRAAHLRVAGLLGAQTRPRLLRRPYEEESQTRRMALPDQGGGDASQKRASTNSAATEPVSNSSSAHG